MMTSEGHDDIKPLVSLRNQTAAVLSSAIGASDEVSCVALCAGHIVVGTFQGSVVCIADGGNVVNVIGKHGSRIHDVSLDSEGKYCASATADGRVVVAAAAPGVVADVWTCEQAPSPILSVALCPDYPSPTADSQSVCIGGEDGRLVLLKRSLFGGRIVIHANEGAISRICWNGKLITWANGKGVKMFNIVTGQKVTYIGKPAQMDCYSRCSMVWASDDTLILAWGLVVKVIVVMEQPKKDSESLYAEVRHQLTFSETVCGVGIVGARNLGILTSDHTTNKSMLHLGSFSGDIYHTVEVPLLKGGAPSHQHLAYVDYDLPMYVLGPRDLVVVQVHDFFEHVIQLVEHNHLEEAVRLANGSGDAVPGLRNVVCLKCVAPHLREKDFQRACDTISSFSELDSTTWEQCIVLFDKSDGLEFLALNVPVPPDGIQLTGDVYDSVLMRLVASPKVLRTVLHWWPPEIFSVSNLKNQLRESLPDLDTTAPSKLNADGRYRVEALAMLEVSSGNVVVAAQLYFGLKNAEVFKLVQHDFANEKLLVDVVRANIPQLFEIDDSKACAIIVDHVSVLPVDTVVTALRDCDTRWRHEYFKLLFQRNDVASRDYHMQMIRLYAEYEPQSLLHFLKISDLYPIDGAVAVCQRYGLLQEEAYLRGRKGEVSEALKILLEKMGDVQGAIAFASLYPDPKLWEELVSYVLPHPVWLALLLEHLDTYDSLGTVGCDEGLPQPPPVARPKNILRRVPPGTPVIHIAASVQRVFDSFQNLCSLRASCSYLAQREMLVGKNTFITCHQRALVSSPSAQKCGICGDFLKSKPSRYMFTDDNAATDTNADEIEMKVGIVLKGRSAFHEWCYENAGRIELVHS